MLNCLLYSNSKKYSTGSLKTYCFLKNVFALQATYHVKKQTSGTTTQLKVFIRCHIDIRVHNNINKCLIFRQVF